MAVVCFLGGLATGKLVPGKRGATASLLAAVIVAVVIIAGTHGIAVKYGSLVTRLAVLASIAMVVAIIGGYGCGRGLRTTAYRTALANLLISMLLVIGAIVGIKRSVGQVLTIAEALEPAQSAKSDPDSPRHETCRQNLQALYSAMNMYAEDWGGLPPSANWAGNNDFVSRVPHNSELHCPAVSNGHDSKFGYAYNTAVAGKSLGSATSLKQMKGASTTPLLYDSSNLAASAADAFKSLPKPGRHHGKDYVLYLDGHIDAVTPR